MVKNKSKNKKTLFKFGTMKNNKEQLLLPINISHRPSHGYIPAGANTEDLRSSRAHQQRLTVTPQVAITTTHGAANDDKSCQTDDS